jgi:predicted  nucleic acid-binding Zn-ribbon protein
VIRLICEKCGHVWYTSNTRSNQKCSDCDGHLFETDLINAKNIEKNTTDMSEKKDECKVIHLDFN